MICIYSVLLSLTIQIELYAYNLQQYIHITMYIVYADTRKYTSFNGI